MGRQRDIKALRQIVFGRTHSYVLNRIVYREANFRCKCGSKVFEKIGRQKGIEHICTSCGTKYMFVPRALTGATIF